MYNTSMSEGDDQAKKKVVQDAVPQHNLESLAWFLGNMQVAHG